MDPRWKLSFIVLAVLAMTITALPPAKAQIPDPSTSYYVPQRGTVATPVEGTAATTVFRVCPNNEGGTSLPNNARIKVILRDASSNGIPGISAADICILFNGGTAAQGFSGVGADSVIANSQWNQQPLCPDVRCVQADADTDASGVTYITFTGSTPGQPGVGRRDPSRKWGHYDTRIPVYVLGIEIFGRLTTASVTPDSYTLQIKNFDVVGGLGAVLNQGEAVTSADLNACTNIIGIPGNPRSWWCDFDGVAGQSAADFNLIASHTTHDCDSPQTP